MKKQKQDFIGFILTAGILLFLLLNAYQYFFRIDLTSNKSFTISQVSKSLFMEIPEEVSITYYVTDKLKRFSAVPVQVEDMLYEYSAFSRGKIRVSIKNPEKSDMSSRLEYFGVAPQQVQIIEKNEQSMSLMYSGIVIEYLDTFKTLPLVFQTESLEYDLTLNIKNLIHKENKTIGIIIGEDGKTADGNYRYLMNQLSVNFTVRELKQGEDIGADITSLIVLGFRDIDEYEFFPIDQYIMKGGKVFFTVPGVSVDPGNNFTAEKSETSPVLSFLELNGVSVKRALLLDKYAKRIPIRQTQGSMVIQMQEWYPHWISVIEKNSSRNNPITSRFQGVDLLWPSPLSVSKKEGIESEILLRSSDEAWLMTDYLNANPAEARIFGIQADRTKGRYDLAAALSGRFVSYFEGRPIPERTGEPVKWTGIVPSSPTTRMLVVGNADFLSDFIQYSGSSYNMLFLENTAEWLTNNDELLSIKTRPVRDERLNRIEDPSRKQMTLFFAEFLNIYFIPIILAVAGIVRALRRKERASHKKAVITTVAGNGERE